MNQAKPTQVWNDVEDEESGEDVADAQVTAGDGGGYGGAAGHGDGLIAALSSSCAGYQR